MKLDTLFKTLRDDVLKKQRVLAELYFHRGHLSLRQYVDTWRVAEGKPSEQLLGIVKNFAEEIYGSRLAQGIKAQLTSARLVSTVDHHGILNHPFFVNSNLIYSLRQDLQYLLVLATAGVSLNNSSWPAALLWTVRNRVKRLSFFPDRDKTLTVLSAPPLTMDNFDSLVSQIKAEPLAVQEQLRLTSLIDELQTADKLFDFQKFYQQASVLSTLLWSKIFPSSPPVIYLPLEILSVRYLIEVVNVRPDSILFKIFYTPKGWALLHQYFNGSLGAFGGSQKGSFLFWGISQRGKRVRLSLKDRNLEGENFQLRLEPAAVSQALFQQRLYPTMLVNFLILITENVVCLGGFNQVNWLTDIRLKFAALLRELHETALAEQVSKLPSNNFAEGNLAFLPGLNIISKPSGLDLYLFNDTGLFAKYHQLASVLTLRESIDSLMPEIYRVITPFSERDPRILSLTDEQIVSLSGMEEKIKSFLL